MAKGKNFWFKFEWLGGGFRSVYLSGFGRKVMQLGVENAIMGLSQQGLLAESKLTEFLNPSYRIRTLKRGFDGAFVVTSKVNAVVSKFGGFLFYPWSQANVLLTGVGAWSNPKITPSDRQQEGSQQPLKIWSGFVGGEGHLLIDIDKARSRKSFAVRCLTARNTVNSAMNAKNGPQIECECMEQLTASSES